MKNLLGWIGNNFFLVLVTILAILSTIAKDYGASRFYITIGVLFIVLQELSKIKSILKNLQKEKNSKP